jgi:hypothetical protein
MPPFDYAQDKPGATTATQAKAVPRAWTPYFWHRVNRDLPWHEEAVVNMTTASCGDLHGVLTESVRIRGAQACSVDVEPPGVAPADGECAVQEARLNVGALRGPAVGAGTGARIRA